MRVIAGFLFLCVLLILAPVANSQRPSPRTEFRPNQDPNRTHNLGEFTFARLIYSSDGWRRMWTTDYPKADQQFIMGLRNWVRSSSGFHRLVRRPRRPSAGLSSRGSGR